MVIEMVHVSVCAHVVFEFVTLLGLAKQDAHLLLCQNEYSDGESITTS